MNASPSIQEVVRNDLCIACGACIPACPYSNISPAFSMKRGAHEVAISDPTRCSDCAQPCDAVCPSIRVDFVRQLHARDGSHDADNEDSLPTRDGWMQAIHLAWSPKFQADGVSSSGGVTRAILANSLKNGTPVVCLAWDADRSDYSPRRLESLRDIDLVPGSIYHSTTFVGALDLIRSAEDPVVLIAIPCQLSGLLQYIANHEHSLAKKIGLVVGIVCGWMYSHHAVKAFAQFIGSEQPDVTKTTYRGGDRVGKLVVRSRGKDQSFDRRKFQSQREAINYQSSFSRDMNRLRCRMCQDHLNLAADIVVGDAWLSRNSDKKSIVACRTSRGEAALSALVRANALKLEPSS